MAFEAIAPGFSRLAHVKPKVHRGEAAPEDASALVVVSRGAEARLSVSDEDRERDRARLEKELAEAERLLLATRKKLANESFVSKAPTAVVDGVRARETELVDLTVRLREHLGD